MLEWFQAHAYGFSRKEGAIIGLPGRRMLVLFLD